MVIGDHEHFQKWKTAYDRMAVAAEAYRQAVTRSLSNESTATLKRELAEATVNYNIVADAAGINNADRP